MTIFMTIFMSSSKKCGGGLVSSFLCALDGVFVAMIVNAGVLVFAGVVMASESQQRPNCNSVRCIGVIATSLEHAKRPLRVLKDD